MSASKRACVPGRVPCDSWPGLIRTMSASYLPIALANSSCFVSKYLRISQEPPALITPLAIGIESMRWPLGPLSVPPFLAPGTLNSTTQALTVAPAGDGSRVLYRACLLSAAGAAANPIAVPATRAAPPATARRPARVGATLDESRRRPALPSARRDADANMVPVPTKMRSRPWRYFFYGV